MGKLKKAIVIGVDPGGAHTGIVARKGRTLIDYALVERAKTRSGGRTPVEHFAAECAGKVVDMGANAAGSGPVVFSIERVVPPRWYSKGQERPIKPSHLIDVSIVAGMIAGRVAAEFGWGAIQWVRPGGHGKPPQIPAGKRLDRYMRSRYPADLLPRRSAARYQDSLRHCRSAWDVSLEWYDFKGAE